MRTVPELLLLLLILAAVVRLIVGLIVDGYLLQPFLYDTRDTFMDWFNSAFWAHRDGAYSVWRTVYPPLSFVFLEIFSTASCYIDDPLNVSRDCDIFSQVVIVGFYLVGMILAFVAFRRNDPRTAWIRGLALALSYPGLFVLERGNLIIPCFIFFVLAYGNLLRDGWGRAIAIGITINFKPYLLMPALGLAIPRRWRMLELAGIATVAVFLISYGIVGAGSPMEIYSNTLNWIDVTGAYGFGTIYQTTTLNTFFEVIDQGFHILNYMDSHGVELWLKIMRISLVSVQALTIAALVGAWLQPRAISVARMAALLLTFALSRQSPGGYTEVFVLFLVFLEPWDRRGQIVALVATYLLAIPYDYAFAMIPAVWPDSWLTGRAISAQFGVSFGMFLRPVILLVMLAALAIDTLDQAIRAHRRHRPVLWLAMDPPRAMA